jgi:uncharacterized paraquat-inducible protein A
MNKNYVLFIAYAAVAVMGLAWCGQFLTSFAMYYAVPVFAIDGVAFKYGMWDGVRELYNQNLYGVATIILFWSGIWPHFKLLLLMIFNWVPASYRKKMVWYQWLSEFGKWSFVDIWVVILLIIIVRMSSGSLQAPVEGTWFQGIFVGRKFSHF